MLQNYGVTTDIILRGTVLWKYVLQPGKYVFRPKHYQTIDLSNKFDPQVRHGVTLYTAQPQWSSCWSERMRERVNLLLDSY